MGHYISQTSASSGDLTNAIGNAMVARLWSDESGGVSQTAINDSIISAESIIDGTLCGIYQVPITLADLTTPPAIIKTIAKDIAVYYGFARKPEFFQANGGLNPWSTQYKTAMGLLKNIQEGDVRLETETAQKPANIGGEVYSSSTYFIVDPNESGGATGGF